MRRRDWLLTLSTIGLMGCIGSDEERGGDTGDDSDSDDDGDVDADDAAASNDDDADGDTDADDDAGDAVADDEATDIPDQPSMRAEPFDPDESDQSLLIRWNGRVFDTVTFPDEEQFWTSDDDEQYLILQLAIENTGDEPAEFVPGQLQITADGAEAEWTVLVDGSRLDVTLEPGDEIEDWLAYTIPADSDEIVITASPTGDAYTADFEHDEGLEIPFVPHE